MEMHVFFYDKNIEDMQKKHQERLNDQKDKNQEEEDLEEEAMEMPGTTDPIAGLILTQGQALFHLGFVSQIYLILPKATIKCYQEVIHALELEMSMSQLMGYTPVLNYFTVQDEK